MVSPGRTLRYEGFSPVASGLEKPLLAGYKRGKRNDLFLAWMTTTVSLKREGEKAILSSYIYPAEVDFPERRPPANFFVFKFARVHMGDSQVIRIVNFRLYREFRNNRKK